MRAIQNYLPDPRHTEVNRIFVDADPHTAWQTVRHFDMSQVSWIRLLFDIRTLPERMEKRHPEANRGLGVDEITRSETGFMILHEHPDHEVVVGSIGRFWHLKIPFEKVTPDEFVHFDRPGYGKIAWAISVEPFREGSTISVELRISATDDKSWKKLRRYYGLIGIGSQLIRRSVMSHLEADLGKMVLPPDESRSLPGDERIPDTRYSITHHQRIEAPVAIVWRYLMQLGCDRAGWYSIDALDNGGKASTDHLVDEWSARNIGDRISATPAGDSFFQVYAVDHENHFVIGGEKVPPDDPFRMTWSFVLEPIGDDATHLISRARMESSPEWKEWLMGKIVYPPVHGLMSCVQLDTIRKYAERDAQARQPVVEQAKELA